MREIDMETWDRKEIFELFSTFQYPFFSVTLPVEVTKVKEYSKKNDVSFYYLMIWLLTKAINRIPEFNMRIRDGKVYQIDFAHPDFTVLQKGSRAFQFVFLPWLDEIKAFCESIDEQIEKQGKDTFGGAGETDEAVYYTCTPWYDFTAATNPHTSNTDDTIPRICWGKYYEENGKLMLHMSFELNHRTLDGYHVGLLKEEFDKVVAELA